MFLFTKLLNELLEYRYNIILTFPSLPCNNDVENCRQKGSYYATQVEINVYSIQMLLKIHHTQ